MARMAPLSLLGSFWFGVVLFRWDNIEGVED